MTTTISCARFFNLHHTYFTYGRFTHKCMPKCRCSIPRVSFEIWNKFGTHFFVNSPRTTASYKIKTWWEKNRKFSRRKFLKYMLTTTWQFRRIELCTQSANKKTIMLIQNFTRNHHTSIEKLKRITVSSININ